MTDFFFFPCHYYYYLCVVYVANESAECSFHCMSICNINVFIPKTATLLLVSLYLHKPDVFIVPFCVQRCYVLLMLKWALQKKDYHNY